MRYAPRKAPLTPVAAVVVATALLVTGCASAPDSNEESTASFVKRGNGLEEFYHYELAGDNDSVLKQTIEVVYPYASLHAENHNEAKKILEDALTGPEGVKGVTYGIEFQEDRAVETLTVEFAEAKPGLAALYDGLTVSSEEGEADFDQSVAVLQDQGYTRVDE